MPTLNPYSHYAMPPLTLRPLYLTPTASFLRSPVRVGARRQLGLRESPSGLEP